MGRGGMQLRPWEIEQLSDEEKGTWSPGSDFQSRHKSPESQEWRNANEYSLKNEAADPQCVPMPKSLDNSSPVIIPLSTDPSHFDVYAGDARPKSGEVAAP